MISDIKALEGEMGSTKKESSGYEGEINNLRNESSEVLQLSEKDYAMKDYHDKVGLLELGKEAGSDAIMVKVDLPFPKEGFASKDELRDAIRKVVEEDGRFMIYTAKGGKNKGRGILVMNCVCSGQSRNRRKDKNNVVRVGSTIKTGCPFRIKGMQYAGADRPWKVSSITNHHNHEFSNLSLHHRKRKLTEKECEEAKQQHDNGVAPRFIVANFKSKDASKNVIARDVSNAVAKKKRDILGGRTPIQALYDDMLKSGKIRFRMLMNKDGKVTHLVIIPPDSEELVRRYTRVVLVDSTYKTNRFKMPLFHGVNY